MTSAAIITHTWTYQCKRGHSPLFHPGLCCYRLFHVYCEHVRVENYHLENEEWRSSVLAPKLESFQPEMVTEWNLLLKNQARWESERSYCETGPEKSLAVASNGLIFLQCALLNSYGKYCCCAFCRVLPWHVNCILNFTIFHVETNLFPTSWGNNIIFKLIFQLWTLKKKKSGANILQNWTKGHFRVRSN